VRPPGLTGDQQIAVSFPHSFSLTVGLDCYRLWASPANPQSELTFSLDDYGKIGNITTEVTGAAVIDRNLATILPAHVTLDILKHEE
jgi:hypothetical protein